MKPLIKTPRQIDYIVNYFVFFFCFITNYRFGLIAYSKMFPKPYIPIDVSSRLTPISYLLVTSLLIDIIPLTGSGIIVYK
jgi:hypothetical protein